MTALVLDSEHYTGDVVNGFEVRQEIVGWCNAHLKAAWKPVTDYQHPTPSKFEYADISFTVVMLLTQPAIEFEDENDLVHFKLRWFG